MKKLRRSNKRQQYNYSNQVSHSVHNILLGSGAKRSYKGKYYFKNYDNDAVINAYDCKPYNRKKQGILKSVIGNNPVSTFLANTFGSGKESVTTTKVSAPTITGGKSTGGVITGGKSDVYTPSRPISYSGSGGSGGYQAYEPAFVPGAYGSGSYPAQQYAEQKKKQSNPVTSSNANLGTSNLNQGIILSQKQIDVIRDSRGNKVPVYRLEATENGVTRNATKEERDYYKGETNYLQASSPYQSPIANTKFYKGARNIITGFEEKITPAIKTIRSAPDLLWFFFPNSDEAIKRNENTTYTPTQTKIKGFVKNITATPFYMNFISSQGLQEKAGGKLRYEEVNIGSAGLSSQFDELAGFYGKKKKLSSALGESRFSNLGQELVATEKATATLSKIQRDILEKTTRQEQLKYLSSIRKNLKSEGSIKNFDNFVKTELYEKNFIKPLATLDLNKNTLTYLAPKEKPIPRYKGAKGSIAGGVSTGLFIADIKTAFAENKPKEITYQKVQPKQNDFMAVMLGTPTKQAPKNKPRENTVSFSNSFTDTILGTPSKTEPRTTQVSIPRTTQGFGYPSPTILYPYFKIPSYFRLPKKPQPSYSYNYPTRSGRTKTGKRAYQPSISAWQLGIGVNPKKFKYGQQWSGLELRPILFEKKSEIPKDYMRNLNKVLLGKTPKYASPRRTTKKKSKKQRYYSKKGKFKKYSSAKPYMKDVMRGISRAFG